MGKRFLAALIMAASLCGAQAAIVTGTYDLTGSFNDNSSGVTPFSTNHLVMDTTYDTDTNALTLNVTTFDLDGVSWLNRTTEYRVEDLSGNGRFRASFRQQTMPDGSRRTFEVFYRFVWSFPGDSPITGSGNIVSILSVSGIDGSFNGRASASFTPTPPPKDLPEPSVAWLTGLALLLAAAARRRT